MGGENCCWAGEGCCGNHEPTSTLADKYGEVMMECGNCGTVVMYMRTQKCLEKHPGEWHMKVDSMPDTMCEDCTLNWRKYVEEVNRTAAEKGIPELLAMSDIRIDDEDLAPLVGDLKAGEILGPEMN